MMWENSLQDYSLEVRDAMEPCELGAAAYSLVPQGKMMVY